MVFKAVATRACRPWLVKADAVPAALGSTLGRSLMPESRDEKPGLLGQQLHSQTGREAPLHLLIFMDV